MNRVLVIDGPNLNLLGTREPSVYGSTSLADLHAACRRWGAEVGVQVDAFQSNHEGALIDRIHSARENRDGIVINPGALTHYSYALHDALEAVEVPAVEVHISNVAEREAWRRVSVVRPACVYTIYGRGIEGYRWAIRHLVHRAEWPFDTISYGDDPAMRFDLRLPEADAPAPLVVLLHGGFWRHQWTRDTTESIAIDLARRGFATANLEYRRVGGGGGWPVTVDDVVRGIDAARRHAGVDGRSVAVVGHSAGAHLGLLAAHHLGGGGWLRLVVSMAGVTDMVAATADGIGDGAARAFLGDADPERASPLHLLPAEFPALVAHGASDDRVPVDYSERYADASGCERLIMPGSHLGVLERGDPMWESVVQRLAARLE